MRELTIFGRRIADDTRAWVCAEIGGNHQGSPKLAHDLIAMCADAGADAVKFQRRHNATLYSQALLDAPYENENSFGRTYGEHRHALELPLDEYPGLIAHAHERGLAFVCTAFDEASATDLGAVGVDALKIASGGVTDLPLLRAACDVCFQRGIPLIVSTGGCHETDILDAWAETRGVAHAFLHCTAAYPCDYPELNLSYLTQLRNMCPNTVIGWSSHDNGIAMAVAAVTLGARIVEKHVTLNRASKGTDHAFSLEREGLRKLCRDLARLHVAWGDGVKRYYDSEHKPIAKMRRRPAAGGMRITGEVDA